MLRYCYIVAEGHQDIEFLIRLFKFDGLKRVTRLSLVDRFWHPLIPRDFPIDDDLTKRVPVPVFLQNAELSIAFHSAGGIKRLSETIEESFTLIPISQVCGIGVVLDADDIQPPQKRFEELTTELLPKLSSLGLSFPSALGEVTKDLTRCGIFIMPNNIDPGTLEDVLLECAQVNYPELFHLSKNYVGSLENLDKNQLTQSDLQEISKPAGKNKAIVSGISSILKPGKSLQVSIQDNRWIDEKTIVLGSIKRVKTFLAEIIGF